MTHPVTRFTDELQAACGPTWQAATEHRFVAELGRNKIDPGVYAAYLIQDHLFVGDLVSLLGAAIHQAPDLPTARPLVEFAELVTSEENDYFHRAFRELGITEADRAETAPGPATQALEAHLAQAAATDGYAETMAVLTAVEWVYLAWAQPLAQDPPGTWYLAEWVDLHATPGFAQFVGWLREQLDAEAEHLSPRQREHVTQLFTRAVELEVAFWDQAYQLAGEA